MLEKKIAPEEQPWTWRFLNLFRKSAFNIFQELFCHAWTIYVHMPFQRRLKKISVITKITLNCAIVRQIHMRFQSVPVSVDFDALITWIWCRFSICSNNKLPEHMESHMPHLPLYSPLLSTSVAHQLTGSPAPVHWWYTTPLFLKGNTQSCPVVVLQSAFKGSAPPAPPDPKLKYKNNYTLNYYSI